MGGMFAIPPARPPIQRLQWQSPSFYLEVAEAACLERHPRCPETAYNTMILVNLTEGFPRVMTSEYTYPPPTNVRTWSDAREELSYFSKQGKRVDDRKGNVQQRAKNGDRRLLQRQYLSRHTSEEIQSLPVRSDDIPLATCECVVCVEIGVKIACTRAARDSPTTSSINAAPTRVVTI